MEGDTFEAGGDYLPVSPQSTWSLESPVRSEPSHIPDRDQRRPSKVAKSKMSKPTLACLNCRTKKVKCQLEKEGCKRCVKLKLQCSVPIEDERRQPSSKKLIRELQETIRELERALNQARESSQTISVEIEPAPMLSSKYEKSNETHTRKNLSKQSISTPSMLARLCGGQWQLNRDAAGQLRCFGPTSSLHVSESVSSSILSWGIDGTRSVSQWQARIPNDLQQELLEIYWKYQHPVLQVVHKKAFLEGLTTRQTPYFSELLLCCIFACAARMSDRPEVRALIFSDDDDEDGEVPFFAATMTTLLDAELRMPGITTVQSLLLLSVLDCAKSNDTKGWLYTGDACRLAYDLGLHRDFQHLGSAILSTYDLEIRQRVFWACFVFDRLWSLYLGRPHCIRLHDVTVPHMKSDHLGSDSDYQMAAAWASLLEIVGSITEILNGPDSASAQLTKFDAQLDDWLISLPETLQYHSGAPPTVSVLHMQYCSALILLHRYKAQFGTAINTSAESKVAREKCVASACQIAQILQNYQTIYGAASTMSGVALHAIATAATTLIANIAETREKEDNEYGSLIASQLRYLKQCMRALGQLEKSYHVTRRVRKIIQLVIRLSNLDLDQQVSEAYITPVVGSAASLAEDQTIPGLMHKTPSDPGTSHTPGDLIIELWDHPDLMGSFNIESLSFPTLTHYDIIPVNEHFHGGF